MPGTPFTKFLLHNIRSNKMRRLMESTLALFAFATLCRAEEELWDAAKFRILVGADRTIFVKFYAPWCGHCKALAPDWKKLAGEFDGHVGKIDCTIEQELCKAEGVKGYPTLKLYKTGIKNGSLVYSATRKLGALRTFLKHQLKQQEKKTRKTDHIVIHTEQTKHGEHGYPILLSALQERRAKTQKIHTRFMNTLRGPARLFELVHGREAPVTIIAPGNTFKIDTLAGHKWIARPADHNDRRSWRYAAGAGADFIKIGHSPSHDEL
jgi:protein disulfide-isomerase-like protein